MTSTGFALYDHPFVPKCGECGELLFATSANWICCPNGHGKLIPRCGNFNGKMRRYKKIRGLPVASKDGKPSRPMRYQISGRDGLFVLKRNHHADDVVVQAVLNGRITKFAPCCLVEDQVS